MFFIEVDNFLDSLGNHTSLIVVFRDNILSFLFTVISSFSVTILIFVSLT